MKLGEMMANETEVPKAKFSLPATFDFSRLAPAIDRNGNLATPRGRTGASLVDGLRIKRVSLEGKVGSRVDARDYRGNGHWEWDGEPLGRKGYTGFIYVIQDVVNEKLYLGKKQYVGAGKLNKGVDSNWRWYISSSKELSESVKANGKEGFRYIAIEEYKSKGALSYAETWSLLHVQTPVYRNKWYNVLINKISWTVKEPPTKRHRDRLHKIMDEVGAVYENAEDSKQITELD